MAASSSEVGVAPATPGLTLADNEAIIERGLHSFVEVGLALVRIRDARQYRDTHPTFEAYCRERWNFTPQRGGQLMAAAKIVETLETTVSTPPPTSEGVVRELKPLADQPERMAEAWEATVKEHGPKPTAAQVRAKVQGEVEPSPEPTGRQQKSPEGEYLWQDEDVLAWAYRLRKRKKWGRKLLVTLAAEEAAGWPYPGTHLPDRAAAIVIGILEDRGKRFGRANEGPTTGQRLRELERKKAEARRKLKYPTQRSPEVAFWSMCQEAAALTRFLYRIELDDLADVAEVGDREATHDYIERLHEDLLAIQDYAEQSLLAVQAYLGDQPLRDLLAKLENMTVANGCPVEEADSFQRQAAVVRRKLANRLNGGS